jgi:hypothetical protein
MGGADVDVAPADDLAVLLRLLDEAQDAADHDGSGHRRRPVSTDSTSSPARTSASPSFASADALG